MGQSIIKGIRKIFSQSPNAGSSVDLGYKSYNAYVTQSTSSQTSGALIVGHSYTIRTFVAGDDFVNVGGTNVTGNIFTASGTTPTVYTNGSTLVDNTVSTITATVLQGNLIQGTPVWTRVSAGIYRATLTGAFLEAKTQIPFGVSLGATTSIAQVLYGATGVEGYIYFDRESDNILRLTCVSAATNLPADISVLIGTGLIMLPEVKIYP